MQTTIFLKSLNQVAWVRVDTQTILTIHTNIITRNQRVSLSQHDNKQWRLHLNKVQESDKGWYMCQINTDPMRSERGYLKVVGKMIKKQCNFSSKVIFTLDSMSLKY